MVSIMTETGVLSQNIKKQIAGNLLELSSVKGNLLSASGDREIKSLYVTSCHPQEGKTTYAMSMAYALSNEAYEKVLLVDGNFQSPKIHSLFNISSDPGLSDLLVAKTAYDEAVRKTEYENLDIIPIGSELPNILDVLTSREFNLELSSLKETSDNDYVIFDGHSLFGTSDASVVSRFFDGIILVVECEKTRWEVVQLAKEKLTKAGGNIIGVVMNKRKYYIPKVLYGKD